MKSRLIGLLIIVVCLALCSTAMAQTSGLPVRRIGIVTDGPWVRYPGAVDLFKQEIVATAAGEFDIRFPADHTLNGNWTVSGVNRAINSLLADPGVDLVVTLGPVSSNEVCKRHYLNKPVVAPFIIDAQIQKLPNKDGASGVANLSYIHSLRNVDRDVRTFRDIAPFNHLTVLVDGYILKAMPELEKRVHDIASKHAIDVHVAGMQISAEEALDSLPPSTQAVLTTLLMRVSADEFQKLVAGLIQRGLPAFSYWGRDDVERGILASTTPKSTLQHLARGVAVNVLEILQGEDAGTLPVTFSQGERLTINMATARAIGIQPGWRILTEADLLNEERKTAENVFTLDDVVDMAIQVNLDLAAAERRVLAGAQQVKETRSVLLPQIGIGANYTAIDEDRARILNGTTPERVLGGSAGATQLIYSETAWRNYTVEKHLQDSRVEDRETVRLDIIQSAATAYLNVLRAGSIERIQKNNLKLARENLERARIRESIGAAGPEEVYRWESEIANSIQQVLNAESLTLDSMTAVNRILNRPLKELFIAEEAELREPLDILNDRRVFDSLDNAKDLETFRDFLVREGLDLAPELRGLDAAIAARERILVAAKRDFWLPTFAFRGNVETLFDTGGTGSNLPGATQQDDTFWDVGVYANLPLFTSGGKTATYKRTQEELTRLRIERDAVSKRIEERIFNAVYLVRSSYPGIRLSRDAEEASRKNLELVMDSYTRGIKSIIDLLDAQNRSLVDNQGAANAVYNFLVDLMTVQRAVGKFIFFDNESERDEWFRKLDVFTQGLI